MGKSNGDFKGKKVIITHKGKGRGVRYREGDIFEVKEDLGNKLVTTTLEVVDKSSVNVYIEGGKYSLM